jgi:hypothetical protein
MVADRQFGLERRYHQWSLVAKQLMLWAETSYKDSYQSGESYKQPWIFGHQIPCLTLFNNWKERYRCTIQSLSPISLLTEFHLLDNLWLISSITLCELAKFMPQASSGAYPCSTEVFNPKIPIAESKLHESICTVIFVKKQSNKLGQCHKVRPTIVSESIHHENIKKYQFQNMFFSIEYIFLVYAVSWVTLCCQLVEL